MSLKALIVESTSYYSDLLSTILSDIGVGCDVFTSGKEALASSTKPEYAFIIVSRYLRDIGGRVVLTSLPGKISITRCTNYYDAI